MNPPPRIPGLVIGLVVAMVFSGCTLLGFGSAIDRPRLDKAALDEIDAMCLQLIEDKNTPGIVLMIGIGDDIVFHRAYGHRMTDPSVEPMTLDTIFDIASLTKPTATASAVMLLVQQGRIALEDPIHKYVPEFESEERPDITVRQLLAHASGLHSYTNVQTVAEMYGPRPNPDGLIRRIAEIPRRNEPGKSYTYSCLNYLVLARMVQNVTGENTDAFLRRTMWEPLGMKDTTYYPTEDQIARTAPTAFGGGNLHRGTVHDPLARYSVSPDYAPGNAGVFCTADDLGRYARMILAGGALGNVRVFEPHIWHRIVTNQAPEGLEQRTAGWGVWTANAWATSLNQTAPAACLGHTGYTGTLVWMDKLSEAYVVMLTNCVYPNDRKENKDRVVATRRRIVSTVLDNLDIYRAVRHQ